MLPYVVQRYGAIQHVALEARGPIQIDRRRRRLVPRRRPEVLAAGRRAAARGWVVGALAGRPRAADPRRWSDRPTLDRGLHHERHHAGRGAPRATSRRWPAATTVDVLVVGGGITGVGVALDAAARGLTRRARSSARDLAQGTSRWSSKLVARRPALPGPGRRRGRVGVARRARRAARPHRAAPRPRRSRMLIPLDADARPPPRRRDARRPARSATRCARAAGTSPRAAAARAAHRRGRGAALAPALAADGLRGALLNWDAQLEDDARLVVAIARTAAAHGARIVTHARRRALARRRRDAARRR